MFYLFTCLHFLQLYFLFYFSYLFTFLFFFYVILLLGSAFIQSFRKAGAWRIFVNWSFDRWKLRMQRFSDDAVVRCWWWTWMEVVCCTSMEMSRAWYLADCTRLWSRPSSKTLQVMVALLLRHWLTDWLRDWVIDWLIDWCCTVAGTSQSDADDSWNSCKGTSPIVVDAAPHGYLVSPVMSTFPAATDRPRPGSARCPWLLQVRLLLVPFQIMFDV